MRREICHRHRQLLELTLQQVAPLAPIRTRPLRPATKPSRFSVEGTRAVVSQTYQKGPTALRPPCRSCLTQPELYDNFARFIMSDVDLRPRIKEMLVKNLMLQTTPDQIGDDLPLFGPNGLGLDSIDALELVVSMEKTFGVGVPNSEVAGKALRTVNTIHDYILEKREKVGQTGEKVDKPA